MKLYTHFTRNKGKQQFFEIYFCSELSPAIVTNHAEICVYHQLVRSLNSNQQEKVTLAESAVRQGSSTEKYIRCYLNILNILVPTEEGRKPKQDTTLHVQFTPSLGCTQRSAQTPWLVFQALGALFGSTAAPELQTETCICPNYMSQWWQDRQHNHQNQQCCQTLLSPPLSNASIKCITSGKGLIMADPTFSILTLASATPTR